MFNMMNNYVDELSDTIGNVMKVGLPQRNISERIVNDLGSSPLKFLMVDFLNRYGWPTEMEARIIEHECEKFDYNSISNSTSISLDDIKYNIYNSVEKCYADYLRKYFYTYENSMVNATSYPLIPDKYLVDPEDMDLVNYDAEIINRSCYYYGKETFFEIKNFINNFNSCEDIDENDYFKMFKFYHIPGIPIFMLVQVNDILMNGKPVYTVLGDAPIERTKKMLKAQFKKNNYNCENLRSSSKFYISPIAFETCFGEEIMKQRGKINCNEIDMYKNDNSYYYLTESKVMTTIDMLHQK